MSTEDPKVSHADETARLQARIEELESQLHARNAARKSKARKERSKLTHETRERAMEEANRVLHALAYALVEHLRSSADVIKAVADEAYKKNEAHVSSDESLDEARLEELKGDLASVVNKGVQKSLDIPRRVLDKFYEVYQEPVHKQA